MPRQLKPPLTDYFLSVFFVVGDVHSERPGYLIEYLSYVNSPLWVIV